MEFKKSFPYDFHFSPPYSTTTTALPESRKLLKTLNLNFKEYYHQQHQQSQPKWNSSHDFPQKQQTSASVAAQKPRRQNSLYHQQEKHYSTESHANEQPSQPSLLKNSHRYNNYLNNNINFEEDLGLAGKTYYSTNSLRGSAGGRSNQYYSPAGTAQALAIYYNLILQKKVLSNKFHKNTDKKLLNLKFQKNIYFLSISDNKQVKRL